MQSELPSDDDPAKLLSACKLHPAEVVELADTPSMALGLLILSKFLIAALISFTPISYADPLQNGP
jgi:hypothetical protein